MGQLGRVSFGCSKMKDLVVLAYSGGLDTSCILKWLLEKNYDVVCYMADVGQVEDFELARQKALKIGAREVVIDDRKKDFVENYVLPSIKMGLLYEDRYLLGTSLARPCISMGLVETAKKFNATYVSHGATGKGNDQVRFELSVYSLWPKLKVLAPWRDEEFFNKFRGRQDLITYAKQHNIPVPVTPKEPWSMDANLMHISYESGVLENPSNTAPENIYQMTQNVKQAPDDPVTLKVKFFKGLPVCVELVDKNSTKQITDSFQMVKELNILGGKHGIGRIDIVENRFIGLKSRGVYETPAGTILQKAHLDLEVYTLDREVLRLKRLYQDRMSDYVYNGLWFSPEAYYARHCLEFSQVSVSGEVQLKLHKGNVIIENRFSETSLYNERLVSMDDHGGLDPSHSTGFINIHAIRLKQYAKSINQGREVE